MFISMCFSWGRGFGLRCRSAAAAMRALKRTTEPAALGRGTVWVRSGTVWVRRQFAYVSPTFYNTYLAHLPWFGLHAGSWYIGYGLGARWICWFAGCSSGHFHRNLRIWLPQQAIMCAISVIVTVSLLLQQERFWTNETISSSLFKK